MNSEIGTAPQRFQKGLRETGKIEDALYPNHLGRDWDERMMGERREMTANKKKKIESQAQVVLKEKERKHKCKEGVKILGYVTRNYVRHEAP